MDHSGSPARKPNQRPTGWSRRLARPVPLRGGSDLVTLADARTFFFKQLTIPQQESPNWRRVTALLLSAARSEAVDVADVTIALEMAASMDEAPLSPEPK